MQTRRGLKLNGTNQLLFNADDIYILGEGIRRIKKNTEVLLLASNETDLEEDAELVMCRKQHVRTK